MSLRLSLCMATFRRGAWIGETIESILPQLGEQVELVVVDGASPDDTEQVVRPFLERSRHIRYFREEVNSGVDADYDKAVGYARGDYCWLVADDDLLAPAAVGRVLAALAGGPDVVVVDAEVRDRSMRHLLDPGRLGFVGERVYAPGEADRLLAETGDALSFIGGTIIRRDLWLERDRAAYDGSLFIHFGVIFQKPLAGRATAIGEPLVRIRFGNAMWTSRSFEIWMFKWPELVWGLAGYSDSAKAAVVRREPWRRLLAILLYRANGAFDLTAFRRFFAARRVGAWRLVLLVAALFPARLAHLLAATMLSLRGQGRRSGVYNLLTCSPHSTGASRLLVRRLARPTWLEAGG